MVGWFETVYGQPAPEKLRAAAARLQSAPAVSPVAMEAPEPPPMAPVLEMPVSAVGSEVGVEATLRRLQELEAFAHAQYRNALSAADEPRANMYLRQIRELAPQIRQFEKTIPELQANAGTRVPITEVRQAVTDLLSGLRTRIEAMGTRYRERLLATDSAAAWQIEWMAACAETFAQAEESDLVGRGKE